MRDIDMADQEPTHEIISRKDAESQGLKHYFTGEPCAKGHLSKRYVNVKGKCFQCSHETTLRWRKNNREKTLKINERRRERYAENPEPVRMRVRKAWARRYKENPEPIR